MQTTERNPGYFQLTGSYVTPDGQRIKVDLGGATVTGTFGSMENNTENVVLQSGATVAGNGTPYTVGAKKTLTLAITGTSTSFIIVFEEGDADGNYTPCMGVRRSDLSTGTQSTATGEVWQFDFVGAYTFRARISAIGNGNVTAKGKAVA